MIDIIWQNWVINLQNNPSVSNTVLQNPLNYSQTASSNHQYSTKNSHYSTPNLQYQSHSTLLHPVPIQPFSKPNTLDLPSLPPLTPSVITEEDDNQCSLCSHCSCSGYARICMISPSPIVLFFCFCLVWLIYPIVRSIRSVMKLNLGDLYN